MLRFGGKTGNHFWASDHICCKNWIYNFFHNIEIWCLGPKHCFECFKIERKHPKHTCKMLLEILISKKWILPEFLFKENITKLSLEMCFACALLIRSISEFIFWTYRKHQISIFWKKVEIGFLRHISQIAQKTPNFLPKSSNMVKPSVESYRVDPGDAFTHLSWIPCHV